MKQFLTDTLIKLSGTPDAAHLTDVIHIRPDTWIPIWLFPFLMAALAFAAFGLYRTEKSLSRPRYFWMSTLRTLVYWAILFVMSGFELTLNGEGYVPGVVPVVLDATRSMGIKDAADQTMRYEQAKNLAEGFLNSELDPSKDPKANITPRLWRAGNEFEAMTEMENGKNPDGDFTAFAQILEKSLSSTQGEPCSAIVLYSDGANNLDAPLNTVLSELKKKKVPVYTVGVGKDSFRDIEVCAIHIDNIVFKGEKCKANIRIKTTACQGENISIKATVEGEDVFSGTLTPDKDGEQLFPVEFTPAKTGVFEFKVTASEVPGEAATENNSAVRNFRVIDEKIRVLMIFGAPSWEYRYLLGAFQRDSRVDLRVHLLDLDTRRLASRAPGEENLYLATVPDKAEEYNKQFDMVFLSGVDVSILPPGTTAALARFVEEFSGALVIASDPTFIPYTLRGTELEPLVPMTILKPVGRSYADELENPKTEPLRFVMTDEGQSSELLQFSPDPEENKQIWALMPPIYQTFTAGKLKPSAVSLLAAFQNERKQLLPAVMMSSYGHGSVLFMAFDSTWRWRKEFGDRFFRDFWGKVVQFMGLPHLMNEAQRSAIYVSSENTRVGERLAISARVFDAALNPVTSETVRLTIRKENGETETTELLKTAGRIGMYKSDWIPKEPGAYQVELDAAYNARPISLRVIPHFREFVNCGLDEIMLKKIAEETGGTYFTPENADTLLETLLNNRKKETFELSVPLWDSMWLLILALALLSMEWIFRKLYCLD